MKSNPNASAAGLTGSLTVVIMFVLSSLGVNLDAGVASAITTLLAAAVLFVGRSAKKVEAPKKAAKK